MIRHGKEVKWLWFRHAKVKVCITGKALALLSVPVTKVRESPPWRGGESVLELLRRQERQCRRRVPGAVPCSLMGGEVICKE